MFFLGVALFYVAGDEIFHLYTYSPLGVYVLLGLAIIELLPRRRVR